MVFRENKSNEGFFRPLLKFIVSRTTSAVKVSGKTNIVFGAIHFQVLNVDDFFTWSIFKSLCIASRHG